ncbi:MAG TPA: hypothetical protein VGX25_28465 [Actinophytocola sp.]|uniref:hypothetical protein n=1 Tax=Actinophytocola sp. TaxID=1872138 RepID=UPI002DDD22E1|nr:hypothetical protein [Actinophytocola sp.]HEV2783336.1 hypothetical protein [Actinophytocola sp.]
MPDKHSASLARALAVELRDLRRKAKLTTRPAADRIGISSASLNRKRATTGGETPAGVRSRSVA